MAHFSKTQYNAISTAYDSVNDLPISRAIVVNVERLIRPHIRGARVLELACGTGFFTRHMLDWGAASVVGVDVSPAMVAVAEAETAKQPEHAGKYRFMVADCSAPFSADGGGFDLVFAAWLLNYAPDQASMAAMFGNIATHLKPGGRLVSVLPHPEDDPMVCIAQVNAQRALGYGYGIEVRKALVDVPHGYYVHLFFDTAPPVDFGNYYLPSVCTRPRRARAA
ncbi:Methyltransferase domain-containing protein [Cladophialophora immunda]|nr:Methyltransferase domain-containing protein [Cladophialophora immunda]